MMRKQEREIILIRIEVAESLNSYRPSELLTSRLSVLKEQLLELG